MENGTAEVKARARSGTERLRAPSAPVGRGRPGPLRRRPPKVWAETVSIAEGWPTAEGPLESLPWEVSADLIGRVIRVSINDRWIPMALVVLDGSRGWTAEGEAHYLAKERAQAD